MRSLALACLVVLAGCSFGAAPTATDTPTTTPEPVQVNVTNDASTSYTFTVGVVNRSVDRVRLTFENGSTRTVDVPVDGIARVYGYTNLTDAAPVAEQEVVRAYQLSPRSSVQTGIPSPPLDGAVFLTARGVDGTVEHWAVATCDRGEQLRAFDFFITQQGVGAGVGCSP